MSKVRSLPAFPDVKPALGRLKDADMRMIVLTNSALSSAEAPLMVAAHAWDTTGAMRAGCQAAFVMRPGEVLPVTAPRPEIVARDFVELADRILLSEQRKAG